MRISALCFLCLIACACASHVPTGRTVLSTAGSGACTEISNAEELHNQATQARSGDTVTLCVSDNAPECVSTPSAVSSML